MRVEALQKLPGGPLKCLESNKKNCRRETVGNLPWPEGSGPMFSLVLPSHDSGRPNARRAKRVLSATKPILFAASRRRANPGRIPRGHLVGCPLPHSLFLAYWPGERCLWGPQERVISPGIPIFGGKAGGRSKNRRPWGRSRENAQDWHWHAQSIDPWPIGANGQEKQVNLRHSSSLE